MPLDVRRERRKLRIPIAGAAGYTVGMADAAEEARWYALRRAASCLCSWPWRGCCGFPSDSSGCPRAGRLSAMGSLGVFFLLMLLWFLLALRFRWRFQFSILSLLVLIVAVALPCSWLATEMKAARRQREAVEGFERAGGSASYDYEVDPSGR